MAAAMIVNATEIIAELRKQISIFNASMKKIQSRIAFLESIAGDLLMEILVKLKMQVNAFNAFIRKIQNRITELESLLKEDSDFAATNFMIGGVLIKIRA